MKLKKARRVITVISALFVMAIWLILNPKSYESVFLEAEDTEAENRILVDGALSSSSSDLGSAPLATEVLEWLEVKGRAPKTGYSREEFYNGWPTVDGCSLRQRIIKREFGETAVVSGCDVLSGEFDEPYTGEHKVFTDKAQIGKGVQIDHVVALSDAWQKGARYLDSETRYKIATDPLNLLAVDAAANEKKSDGDAATWLPSNKRFRCQYVARQVSVKYRYGLWVTEAEKDAISDVLLSCPNERVVL